MPPRFVRSSDPESMTSRDWKLPRPRHAPTALALMFDFSPAISSNWRVQQKRELNLKKTLWKLVHASRSVSHVLTTCDYFLQHIGTDDQHPMAYPLMCSICVLYVRPFTDNEGVGMISTKFARHSDPRLQKTHDYLWQSRMRFYAHSDATLFATDQSGARSPMHQVRVQVTRTTVPEGTILTYGYWHPETGLRGIVVADVRDLCLALQQRLAEETSTVLRQLFEHRAVELLQIMDEQDTNVVHVPIDIEQ